MYSTLCVRVCIYECAWTDEWADGHSLCDDIHLYVHLFTCVILHVYTISVVGGSSKISSRHGHD